MGTEKNSEVFARLANSSKILVEQSSSPTRIWEGAFPEPDGSHNS